MRRTLVASAGAVAAALLGALCCIGPLVFVALGVGAGLAARFEPLRPVFGVLMLGAFAVAYYSVYGRRPAPAARSGSDAASDAEAGVACVSDAAACTTRPRRRDRVILWVAAGLALLLWSFPSWSRLFV